MLCWDVPCSRNCRLPRVIAGEPRRMLVMWQTSTRWYSRALPSCWLSHPVLQGHWDWGLETSAVKVSPAVSIPFRYSQPSSRSVYSFFNYLCCWQTFSEHALHAVLARSNIPPA